MADQNFGWLGIDEKQKLAASAFPTLAQAAPHLLKAASTDPICLYKAWTDVLGKYPDYPAQQIGDCVSVSNAHAVDLLQCVEIRLGEPSEFRETDSEFIYGESRKVAGILGNQDGSYGSAAMKAMTTVGLVSREMLGTDGPYSGSRAKSWGRTGPPANVEAMAAPFKLGSAAAVTTWDELVAAITNGYPITICSNWGFENPRDKDGFCAPRGTWGHSMLCAGIRFDRLGALICQSWGPDQPTGPTALDQPSYSFWVERPTIEKMLAEGDSWALNKAPDFIKRDVPTDWHYRDLA